MNAYEKSLLLNLGGTDAEKVAILRTLSNENIDSQELRFWLADKGLLDWDGTSWAGLIEQNLASFGTQLQAGVREMKVRLQMGHRIRSAEPSYAPRLFALVSAIAAAIPSVSGLVDSFYALDGGRPFKELTVEAFVALRETTVANQAAENLRNNWRERFDAAMNTLGTEEQADGIADIRAIASEMEG